ncbi:RNA polymerase II-associated protein 1 [Nakaseomyces bracarensis]|uniref:RNA polymerase II-associated protein 1 n=1 Tax=Nakaseomyces bracarensis TaxID=273131 RepID=A0ABR4P0Z9_9SACH
MSKKQDYIAKIKYQNNLPAPLLPPKLMEVPERPEENVDSPQLIDSLYTKTNVTPLIKIDNDLGMPLDLMKIPGLLNRQDTKYLYAVDNSVKLHPHDRVLLRDPRMDRVTTTDMSKVTFLRRTEYVSSSIIQADSTKKRNGLINKRLREVEDDLLSPSQIVEKVESTFETVTKDLSQLQHPVKKKLKAVKTWSLLPDTASMDQNYFTLRLVGSAVLDKQERKKLAVSTAIFRPVELEEDEWISMYATDVKDSENLEKDMERNLEEQVNAEDIVDKNYKFKRFRDYDMKHVKQAQEGLSTQSNPESFNELAIVLNDERGVAFYKPLRSRIELRRRRVADAIRPIVREHNIDQLNIKLRNATPKEANVRDHLRMKYDPINFAAVDEEELEEEEEEKPDQGETKEETSQSVEQESENQEEKKEQNENENDESMKAGSEVNENQ